AESSLRRSCPRPDRRSTSTGGRDVHPFAANVADGRTRPLTSRGTARTTMTMTANPTTVRPGHGSSPAVRPKTARRPRAGDQGLPALSTPGQRLVGRQEQRAALATLVDGACAGRGGAILVR